MEDIMPAYYDEKTKSWFCKFYYTDYTGVKKQKKKRGFKLQREAKEWERNFLERLQGTPDMTFQALYDIYMEDMSHRLREDTVSGNEHIFRNHILPYLGEKPVNSITPADIRAWQNQIIKKDYSEGYLLRIHRALVTALNFAVKYYNLPSNPCNKAGSMGKRTKSINFWTLDQYNSFMEHVTDIRARTAFQLLFYSGIRCGELLALTLGDCGFQENTISITKTFSQKRKASGPPKSDNGARCVSMPEAIMKELQAYTGRIYGIQPTDRIFTFTRNLIRGNIERCSKKAGIPRIRIHDLRHSHVSLLIEMGYSPYLIAERIGDTVQMVIETYGHLYPSKHAEVADRLNQIIVPK